MAVLDRLRLLILATRPMYSMLVPSTYFLGITSSGTYPQAIPAALLAIGLLFPFSLILFGVNDAYDHDTDILNPRKEESWVDGTHLQKADQKLILFAAKVSTVLVLLLAIPASIQSPQVLGYMILSLFIAWTYSAPPLRLKERPIMDSLSNGVICFLIWACGYTAAGNKDLAHHASDILRNGLFIFFAGLAFHSQFAALDLEADAAANQRTVATVLGERLTTAFSVISL
ncbi:prenyltransferase [Arthroderma uncinatum]|uniref:prenyltransferase n=1 Tax=Arthroderma uncinatum TaxID=74035 RepID=UPI00144AF985|nr:prenyltransferase [Arthroderma uncinatum]KAF3481442.1 prenyltransferase [Arthroderma uncinatum]